MELMVDQLGLSQQNDVVADAKLVCIYTIYNDWNPSYSTDEASSQQQEWGTAILLAKKICMLFSQFYFYIFKVIPGVYMFLLQKINRVFGDINILPQTLLLWLEISSVPTST